MAQTVTHLFKSPNSTRALNNHIAKIVAEGAYKGLEVVPTDPSSMSVNITPGYALTNEGVKVEESLQLDNVLTFSEPDPNFPRIDLVVLRHRYTTPLDPVAEPNIATYHIIQGIPTPPPNYPEAPDNMEFAPGLEPDQWLEEGDIVLSEVHMFPGRNFISPDMIFNRTRTMTTTELMAAVARALYMSLGNFVYQGWDLTSDELNVLVSPGEGLLCGSYNSTEETNIITTLRAREKLFGPFASNGEIYKVMDSPTGGTPPEAHNLEQGVNITLDRQPDYPSKLRLVLYPEDQPVNGYIHVAGRNEYDEIRVESVVVNCPTPGQEYVFETSTRFMEVDHEGIDCDGIHVPGAATRIHVTDKPIGYIYAVGTAAGRATFKVVYIPNYEAPCHEYLLGYAETDESQVIDLVRFATNADRIVEEDLSQYCDGARSTFTVMGQIEPGTEMIVIDGSVLKRDSVNEKGYTIDESEFTLQSNVGAPDGPDSVHGSVPTDLWIRYKRKRR